MIVERPAFANPEQERTAVAEDRASASIDRYWAGARAIAARQTARIYWQKR
jgi:hypothetical protein